MSKPRRTVLSGVVTPLVREVPPVDHAPENVIELAKPARRRSATKDATIQQTSVFVASRSRPVAGVGLFGARQNAHPDYRRAGRGVSGARHEVDYRPHGEKLIPL